MRTFGQMLRMYRKQRGMTAQEVADKVGVARATVSRYETGDIDVSITMAEKLAKALRISPMDLIDLPTKYSDYVEQVPSRA